MTEVGHVAGLAEDAERRIREAHEHVRRTADERADADAGVNDAELVVARLEAEQADARAIGQPMRDGKIPAARQRLEAGQSVARIAAQAHRLALRNERQTRATVEREIATAFAAEFERLVRELEATLWAASQANARLRESWELAERLLGRKVPGWPAWWRWLNAETSGAGSFFAGWRRFVRTNLRIPLPPRGPGWGDD